MKIVCLGDSITWGYPWGPVYSWVKLAAESTGFTVVNKGVNGDTTEDLLLRFDKDVAALNPTHVILMAGTNDACLNIPLKQFAANCHALIEKALSYRIIPSFGLPIPANDNFIEKRLIDYRQWLTEYTSTNNVEIFDFGPICLLDEVHPSQEGYKKMAEIAEPLISNWLEKC